VGEHGALGVARGAGGVRDDGDVLGLALVDLGLEVARMRGSELPPEFLDILVGLEPLLLGPAQAARVVVDHEAQREQLALESDDLVDLLLVLGHDHADLGVVPDVGELLGDGVLVDGNGHAAQALGGDLGPVQARPVVADHGEPVAAGEPERGQTQGEIPHLLLILTPRPGLPDSAVLLTDGRTVSQVPCIALKQAGKRRQVSHVALQWLRPWCLRDRP
jgi:hypothetical protein